MRIDPPNWDIGFSKGPPYHSDSIRFHYIFAHRCHKEPRMVTGDLFDRYLKICERTTKQEPTRHKQWPILAMSILSSYYFEKKVLFLQ